MHIQGYMETKNSVRLAGLKKLNKKAHWEKAMGTRDQAILYCLKEETSIGTKYWLWEDSWTSFTTEYPKSLQSVIDTAQSKKNTGPSQTNLRLSSIREQLSTGNSTIYEDIADNEFDLWVRYYRAFEKYLCMKTPPRNHDVDVHVLQGPTGTGKFGIVTGKLK